MYEQVPNGPTSPTDDAALPYPHKRPAVRTVKEFRYLSWSIRRRQARASYVRVCGEAIVNILKAAQGRRHVIAQRLANEIQPEDVEFCYAAMFSIACDPRTPAMVRLQACNQVIRISKAAEPFQPIEKRRGYRKGGKPTIYDEAHAFEKMRAEELRKAIFAQARREYGQKRMQRQAEETLRSAEALRHG